jgi:cob(I)alamin adenosyltransferase
MIPGVRIQETPSSERSILIMSEQQWDEIPSDLNSQLPIGAPSDGSTSSVDPLIELNAWLGFARACAHSARVQAILLTLQTDLRLLLAHRKDPERFPALSEERVHWLEETREQMRQALPPGFQSPELPGETVSGSILDLASAVAGRARDHQRVEGMDETETAAQGYLDRLPGMLSALARYEEFLAGAPPA